MNRSEVFLDAMGLGPQWRLRHAPVAADADADADVAGFAAGTIDAAGASGTSVIAAPLDDGIEQAPQAVAPMPVAAGVEREAAGADAAAAGMAGLPATRAVAPGGEDTSWFDDAPAAPSTRPALKSAPPARAPAPARPAAGGAANGQASGQANGQVASSAAGGAADADESYAWFDEVPATPVAKPVRKPAPEAEAGAEADAPWRGEPARPAQPKAAPPRQAMPDDGIPWLDDAPLPVFDGEYGDTYDTDAGITDAAIARLDGPALRAAVQSCTRCALCRERSAAVPGRGAQSAPWLVLAAAPNGDDEAQARPLAGAPGQLLDNMLKAIGVAPDAQAYVTTLVKCRPQGDRLPSADEVAACRPYLEREMALAGSRAIVTLGHTAAKGLLGAAARGKVLRLGEVPVVATYHPADLLRKPEDKARAWADLCLARSAFDATAPASAGSRP